MAYQAALVVWQGPCCHFKFLAHLADRRFLMCHRRPRFLSNGV